MGCQPSSFARMVGNRFTRVAILFLCALFTSGGWEAPASGGAREGSEIAAFESVGPSWDLSKTGLNEGRSLLAASDVVMDEPVAPKLTPKPAPKPAAGQPQAKPTGSAPPKASSKWTDPATGLEFVWAPAGCFEMGSPSYEQGRDDDEGPVHEVCVEGFFMGKTEVTVGAFRRFVNATGYRTEAERDGYAYDWNGKEWVKKPNANWHDPGFAQNDDHPVEDVSWNDAKAMVDWLTRQGNGKFRLPTEAEWEYACSAGTRTARFWGDSSGAACAYANVADKSGKRVFNWSNIHDCDDQYVYTAPVGRFQANNFGLFDMLGNVNEWCEDIYSKNAYGEHQRNNPIYIGGGSDRVVRGGGWYYGPRFVRCADRFRDDPARRSPGVGFRLVRNR